MTLAILCPGQSAQGAGMLEMLKDEPEARAVFESFAAIIGERMETVLARPERLHDNAVAQPVLCATALASFAVMQARLPEPPAVIAGYSIGELAAYGCAGALAPAEIIRLARARARAMDAAFEDEAGMVAVRGLLEARLAPICDAHHAHIAIRNGEDRFVVAGRSADIAHVGEEAKQAGAHVTALAVKIASHTPLMAPAADVFRSALSAAPFRPPDIPVIAGINGALVRDRASAIETLTAQLFTPLDWAACMAALRENGCHIAFELLPGNDLSAMLRHQEPALACRALADFRSAEGAGAWLARQM
ncbi:ACP S-malonyltransferase [Rhizobium paknamense]|uniref:[acyl-carrier-protein] S-malonyltransferase n=1 Tax=Rhizobium paknamense TaxID=1206817 RepID=A0ABU0IBQ6_9HYPH|nr:acyltransferase domain-containing protein [Rhizobium paknamense]MDQ0455656.1 [acyl-carrier-protein] S-malonyltransferase [Rhizobium paknamense]